MEHSTDRASGMSGRGQRLALPVALAVLAVAFVVLLRSLHFHTQPQERLTPQQAFVADVRASGSPAAAAELRALTDAELLADGMQACALGPAGGLITFANLNDASAQMPPQDPGDVIQGFSAGAGDDQGAEIALHLVSDVRSDLCP